MNNKIYISIIALLIALLIIQQQCHRPVPPSVTTKTVTTTKSDTSKIKKNIQKPVPVQQIISGIISLPDTFYFPYPDTVYKPVLDTAKLKQLLKEFLTKNIYDRVLMNDTNAYIELSDTVYKNELWKGLLTFINRRATQIITNTTTTVTNPDRFKFYIGGTLGGNTSEISSAGINLLMTTRKNNAYAIGNNLLIKQPNINISVYWKIHFK